MDKKIIKKHPSIGCCGIDCSLCPRYYTEGKSRCPGCMGPDFLKVMGQTCGFITCCLKEKGFEACGECDEFPCQRFDSEWFGPEAYDSFVTHKQALPNMVFVKKHGLYDFLDQQQKRTKILEKMLKEYNEGRSKSLYCLACARLSIDGLENALKTAQIFIKKQRIPHSDLKTRAKILKEALLLVAEKEKIILRLEKPPTWKS